MGSKRIVLSDLSLSSVAKKVNTDFIGCDVPDVLGSLAVSQRFEQQCEKLYRKTKAHIESRVNPSDLETLFEKDEQGRTLRTEVVAINTLFGAEYLLGETRWQLRGVSKKGARNTLVAAAMANQKIFDALVAHKILITEYTVDYNQIHSILAPFKSKSDIPEDLAILRDIAEIVETSRTVRVSTIKENLDKEGL